MAITLARLWALPDTSRSSPARSGHMLWLWSKPNHRQFQTFQSEVVARKHVVFPDFIDTDMFSTAEAWDWQERSRKIMWCVMIWTQCSIFVYSCSFVCVCFCLWNVFRFKCRDTIASPVEFQRYQRSQFPVSSFLWAGVHVWSLVSLSACKASSVRGGENLQDIIENIFKDFNHFKQRAVLTYFFAFGTFYLNMPKPFQAILILRAVGALGHKQKRIQGFQVLFDWLQNLTEDLSVKTCSNLSAWRKLVQNGLITGVMLNREASHTRHASHFAFFQYLRSNTWKQLWSRLPVSLNGESGLICFKTSRHARNVQNSHLLTLLTVFNLNC